MRDIQDVAKYVGLSLLSKGLSVSPLKLQKILYYAQAWNMVFFGRNEQLFKEAPQAWVNGPVYPVIFHEYKNKVQGMCDHLRPEHFGTTEEEISHSLESLVSQLGFSGNHLSLLESVIRLYGSRTQNQLILMTHSEDPWCEKREGLMPYEKSTSEISLDTMYSYYKKRHDANRSKREANA